MPPLWQWIDDSIVELDVVENVIEDVLENAPIMCVIKGKSGKVCREKCLKFSHKLQDGPTDSTVTPAERK